jgi:predicted PurR-regulated permease PerM
MSKNLRTFLILAAVALVVAVLRYYMKGWLQPMGVSDFAGSFIASITLFTLVGLVIIFVSGGRAAGGSYLHAAAWFWLFAIWCQGLIIGGILIADQTGKATYYDEMMGKHMSLPPVAHALAHGYAAVIVAVVGMILGLPIYFGARRWRPVSASSGQ